MRETSHSFPSTNRACITLSSSLYDRRAIDSPVPTLPLLTSLQHLAYLTSTSPRIREILTQDGGLERLINIVGRCLDLAFPETATAGPKPANVVASSMSSEPSSSSSATATTTTTGAKKRRRIVPFKPFSAYANGSDGQDYKNIPAILHTYGFALQCLVNIGVRGSETIRTRVVEAGILKVVFRILNSFLINRNKKREELLRLEKEQHADSVRHQTLLAMQSLAAAGPFDDNSLPATVGTDESSRSITLWRDNTGQFPTVPVIGTNNPEEEYLLRSTQHHLPSPQQQHQRLPQPPILTSRSYNGHTELNSLASSAVAINAYDPSATATTTTLDALNLPLPIAASRLASAAQLSSITSINRTSTPDTILSIDETTSDMNDGNDDTESSSQENEQDGEQMDVEDEQNGGRLRARRSTRTRLQTSESTSRSTSRTRRIMVPKSAPRVNDGDDDGSEAASATRDQDGDVIMDQGADESGDMTVDATPVSTQRPALNPDTRAHHVEQTPLANPSHPLHDLYTQQRLRQQQQIRHQQSHSAPAAPLPLFNNNINTHQQQDTNENQQQQYDFTNTSIVLDHHFKEDDVLHCLHLLAYLSKYPHVRAVFHDPENESCRPIPPPTPILTPSGDASMTGNTTGGSARKKQRCGDNGETCSSNGCATTCTDVETAESSAANSQDESSVGPTSRSSTRRTCRQGDDEEEIDEEAEDLARAKAMAALPPKERKPALEPARPPRSTANNVFSLVEQFTFRPSSPSSSSSNSNSAAISNIEKSLRMRSDIQYWAGVIMRNACRKDEVKGGIRQCANMGCGVWERFPREFAKCRRCRKAKYCSKGCQRRAWQAGHRYWCSARQDNPPQPQQLQSQPGSQEHPNGTADAATETIPVQIATINTNNQGVEAVETGDVRDMAEL